MYDEDTHDKLQQKIKVLIELMWENRINWTDVQRWLSNFPESPDPSNDERLHALYLLCHFSYFGSHLMRVFVRSLYRDYVQYPLLAAIRHELGDTLDRRSISSRYSDELKRIRFIGIGNPSESGTHLLYYFRQENRLPTQLFVQTHELFRSERGRTIIARGVRHIVFLDDFCGSGAQAETYSRSLLTQLLTLDHTLRVSYFTLFGTTHGLDHVRANTRFSNVDSLYELDSSFRALDPHSRYFREQLPNISRQFALATCIRYGSQIEPGIPLGFRDGQLLLGFSHNIPDNTLPIFWSKGRPSRRWTPIFPRYSKEVP